MNALELSFPQLLWKIHESGKTGVLTVKRADVEKKIYFDSGTLMYAESNLLHETLGKYLVASWVITGPQEQSALIRSVESQKPMGQVLIDMQLLDPAALSESIRSNLKAKILDCFAWSGFAHEFVERRDFLDTQVAFKFNMPRLLLDGVMATDTVDHLEGTPFYKNEKKLRLRPFDADSLKKLELNPDEITVFKHTQKPLFFKDLAAKCDLPQETLARLVHAFLCMGYLREVSPHDDLSLDELVGMTLVQGLKPAVQAVSVEKVDDETRKIANEVASNHLQLLSLNHFELLGLSESATFVHIRDHFIEFAKKYNPARFQSPEMKQFSSQAEDVFLRGVKAFSVLSEFDQKGKYLDKLKAERQGDPSLKKKAGEAFKIQTQLLDADSQFQKGLNYLKTKNYAKAFEFFSYACDIDSGKSEYIAHMAWAKFQMQPEKHALETKEFFERATKAKKDQAILEFFYGKVLCETGQGKEAVAHLKKAVLLEPKNPEYARELRKAETLK